MTAKAKNGNGQGSPVLHFEHIERRESDRFQVNVQVLDMLAKYPGYIAEQTGHKPPVDQVVEKALEQVLNSDVGFRRYLQTLNGKAKESGGKPTGVAKHEGSTLISKTAAQTA